MDYNSYVEKLAQEILEGDDLEKTAGKYMSTAGAGSQIGKGLKQAARGVKNYAGGKGLAMQMNAGRGMAAAKRNIGSAAKGVSGAARNAVAAAKTPEAKAAALKALRNAAIYGGVAGAGAGAGMAGMHYSRQNKVEAYYEEAQMLKQAAEESYLEAVAMEDAAILAYNSIN